MLYRRRVVKRRPASLTDEEWLNIVQGKVLWPPLEPARPPDVRMFPDDPVVLCWWCRALHKASEVLKCMALPEKRSKPTSSTESSSSALDAGFLTPFSEIWAFLTVTVYPDGRKRKTGRLSLSCDSDGIRLSLSDEETGQYASFLNPSVDDLFLAFEEGLGDGSVPWRVSKYVKVKK
jgi:hypothetical protein